MNNEIECLEKEIRDLEEFKKKKLLKGTPLEWVGEIDDKIKALRNAIAYLKRKGFK